MMKNAAAKTGEHYPMTTHASGRRATNAASSIGPPPPFGTKKWGVWMVMRDHTGCTALAYDDDYCKFGGTLNAAVDDVSVIIWDNDNEYGGNCNRSLVKFGLDIQVGIR